MKFTIYVPKSIIILGLSALIVLMWYLIKPTLEKVTKKRITIFDLFIINLIIRFVYFRLKEKRFIIKTIKVNKNNNLSNDFYLNGLNQELKRYERLLNFVADPIRLRTPYTLLEICLLKRHIKLLKKIKALI